MTLTDMTQLAANYRGGWRPVASIEASREWLHRKPFRIGHELASDPLFEIGNLITVAKAAALRPMDLYFDAGTVSVDDKWGQIPVPDMPPDELLHRIETVGAWMIIKHVEVDRRYAAVLSDFDKFVRDLAGRELAAEIGNPEMLVIVSSPGRLTPFHFDSEINFLVQVHGAKDVWICDPADKSIISERDVERYYGETMTAGTYKPEFEAKATKFRLEPGDGVHIPSHAAHWVRNSDNVSVSLSLNFELPLRMRRAYRFNHELRRLGISPHPPGTSAIRDRAKGIAVNALGQARRLVSRSETR